MASTNRFMSIVTLVLVAGMIIPSPYSVSLFVQSQTSKSLSSQSILLGNNELFSMTQFSPSLSISNAYASTSYELQVNNANGNCETIGGTFNSGSNTCTLATSLLLSSGDSLTIDSGVTLAITGSGKFDNLGYITNNGNINNSGKIFSSGGTINNFLGSITNNGSFINSGGTILNGSGGSITNNSGGNISNSSGGTINNAGYITNNGTINNAGTIANLGFITNNSGASITNNDGTINNQFDITNNGSITNNLGGSITNSFGGASITNNAGASITNISGASITNNGTISNSGIIFNSGIINDYCGAVFNGNPPSGNAVVNKCSDTIPPTVGITSPANGAVLNTGTITFNGFSSDTESGVRSVQTAIDLGSYSSATLSFGGSSSSTVFWSDTLSNLVDGHHTIWALATDNAGNTATTSEQFTVDTIPPTVGITSPANGAVLNTGTLTFNGFTSDTQDTVTGVSVSLDFDGYSSATSTNNFANWSFPVSGLSNGAHTVQVQATDQAGNVKTTSETITVAPPSSTVSSSTGSGQVIYATSFGGFSSLTAISQSSLSTPPPPGSYPFGFFSWTISGLTPGGSTNVCMTYPSDPGTVYEKLIGSTWYQIPVTETTNPDGSVKVCMTLTDGATGQDSDQTVNGQITDPGGMGSPSSSPNTMLTMYSNATNGAIVGQYINFTYVEKNTGNVPLSNPSVSDNLCSPVTSHTLGSFNEGDNNGNGILDPGESWIFQCIQQENATGTSPHTAIGTGTDLSGNTITAPAYPSEQTSLAVTINHSSSPVVQSSTGAGPVTLSTGSGQFDILASSTTAGSGLQAPDGTFPYGLFSWQVTNFAPATSVTVTITYPNPVPPTAEYLKWLGGSTWVPVPITISGNTITVTIADNGPYDDSPQLGAISDPSGLFIPSPPLTEKKNVITDLKSLSPATPDDKNDINKAIDQVTQSTDSSLWNNDGIHLVVKKGDQVFDHEKQAVQQLMDVIKGKKETATGFNSMVENAIAILVGVDKTIATASIADANTAASGLTGNHAKDVQNDIAQAQKEMSQASDETSKGHFDAAIDHYKNAWKHAQDAISDAHHH